MNSHFLSSTSNRFLTLILFVICSSTFSQNDSKSSKSEFWQNVRFGGGIGLGVANGFFSATLAPTAVYDLTNDFALGVGLNGTYNSRKDLYSSTIIGGSALALYNPIQAVQMSAEFEELNVSRKFDDPQFKDENYWYPALFLGAGYRTGNLTFGIRYDLLYDADRSIYADPWIPFVRVFF